MSQPPSAKNGRDMDTQLADFLAVSIVKFFYHFKVAEL